MKRKTSKEVLAESFREIAERKNIEKIITTTSRTIIFENFQIVNSKINWNLFPDSYTQRKGWIKCKTIFRVSEARWDMKK